MKVSEMMEILKSMYPDADVVDVREHPITFVATSNDMGTVLLATEDQLTWGSWAVVHNLTIPETLE